MWRSASDTSDCLAPPELNGTKSAEESEKSKIEGEPFSDREKHHKTLNVKFKWKLKKHIQIAKMFESKAIKTQNEERKTEAVVYKWRERLCAF